MNHKIEPKMADLRPKRAWRPWYSFKELPVCHICHVPGIVKHTDTGEDGQKIQRRYCPKCGRSFKSRYRLESKSDGD